MSTPSQEELCKKIYDVALEIATNSREDTHEPLRVDKDELLESLDVQEWCVGDDEGGWTNI